MMKLTREIQQKLDKLEALENGGVDNWEWYDEALKPYFKKYEKEDMALALIEELLEEISPYIEEPAGRGAGYGIRKEGQDVLLKVLMNKVKQFESEDE